LKIQTEVFTDEMTWYLGLGKDKKEKRWSDKIK
jgi:hypothetical protein